MKIQKHPLTVLLVALFLGTIELSALTIDAVRIENLEKEILEDSFIKAYTSLRAGRELASEAELHAAVAQDVESLKHSERFSYVRAFVEQDREKITLVYSITPRLRLRQIEVVGAKKMGNKKVKTELGLGLGDFVDEAVVGQKARKVEAFFRKNKYPDATVTWELTGDKKTGGADLLLTVHEGMQLRVKRIRFEGARFLSEARLARTGRFFKKLVPRITRSKKKKEVFDASEVQSVLNQKTTWWITSWFGVYRPEFAGADQAALRKFYLNHGFLDVKINESEIQDLGSGSIELLYRIHEGEQYNVGAISIDGATLFEPDVLKKQTRLRSGHLASRAAIDAAAAKMTRYYGNRGYIRSTVRPVIQTDPLSRTADICFTVREGSQAFINEITIRGNEKTRDEVLRRELAVRPGELFHQQKIETSERRLKNLDYFESVTRSYVPAAKTNAYDLTFNVKEKAMGSFLVGAGFSTVDSIVGFAEMSHGNFDIKRWPPVGAGEKMKVRVQAGSERNDLEVSFGKPWFLDRELTLGVDLYRRSASFYSEEYDLTTTGTRLSLSKKLTSFARGTLSYSLEQFDILGVSTTAPREIRTEEGSRMKSTLGASVSRNTTDHVFAPTRGNKTTGSLGFSGGPLGGDTEIYSIEAKSSHHWPLINDHIFNIKGIVRVVDSYGDRNVPLFDKLFLGGPRTIRGFAYRDISPRSVDDPNEPIGGNSSFYGTAEYTVPMWSKIRGAVFYDIGAVNKTAFDFGTEGLNSSYGFGARFDLPMFPLRLDYAFPHIMDTINENASPRWNFLLGYTF